MTGFRMSAMSIRAKLALILGVTIFALAATRALGLSQLDGFLDRFKGYTDRLAVVQTEILDSHRRAASPGEIERLAERFKALRAEADAAREAEASILNRTYLTMLILVFGAGVVAYLLIVALITRPLARVAQVADTVARGDLRSEVRVESDDELGRVMRALRDMNVGLAGLIGKVRGTSRSIAAGSDEIASANADFAEQMAGQSAALEQTAAAMTQLSTGIGRAAGHAREASARAEGASGIAAKGGEEVARVAATMRDIEGSARRITEITAVIDGIAFQTNLLALNAAVEAARAGAHGRGFAVVATEVRNLAQKSAAAAREVRTLIEDSLTKVELGAHAVESAGRTMSEIVDNSRDVTRIVGEIASLAGEQAHAVEEVNRAVSEMDRNTRRNTELIERAARTAQEMRGHSIDLNSDVSVFLLADADDAAAADGAPAAVDRPARYPGKTARLARLRASFSDQS